MIYNDKMDEEKNAVYENRIIYSLPVRLGLWNEDLALQEEKDSTTAYKREHCQMLIQKTKKMMRNIMKPTSTAYETAFVSFGENYQIKTSDLNEKFGVCDISKGLFLCGLITEREIDVCQHFSHGCMLTASPTRESSVRNTFKLVGCGNSKDGDQVTCGEDVLIQISEGGNGPLYVQCENSTIDTFGHHLSLRLSSVADVYCRFKILHWNPQRRIETIGTPFKPDTRVIIQHSASGQNLAVEPTKWIPTFFGAECTVSCHTYRDSHKMETAENFWCVASSPKSNKNLFVRAAKGENIPSDIFE
ncbi:cilia- and flagella-associated protein 161 [Sitophilus oryzae]|uniref:Cilia- and flagella-associated protein 161 n=1 Tax=Sitophilus oryzae TaxID=7048 RepID=A0A6J2YV41_SITOR|nr:cilia- and flagella-associated protein 161 [Sitophilus oryzae]